MRILADLPTDRAMLDLSRARWGSESIKRVVETMALNKLELIKAMRHIQFQKNFLEWQIAAGNTADNAIKDFLKDNPEYEIEMKAK